MRRLIAESVMLKKRVAFSTTFSFALHALIIFGITFTLPNPSKLSHALEPLEVTLVNSKSKNKPNKASAYAQHNLDGGGNIEDSRRAKTPFPVMGQDSQFRLAKATQNVKSLEQEVKRLLTQEKSNYKIEQNKNVPHKVESTRQGQDLVQQSLEIARLEAEISKNLSMYEKLPKRKHIGARTQEYRYAQYVEDWRSKVERVGNLNYPEVARKQKIYGKLTLSVSIRADGSVETVEINNSSGHRILDAAAQRIVKLAAPYAPFPPDIRKETDILSITRTWTFTTNDQLESE